MPRSRNEPGFETIPWGESQQGSPAAVGSHKPDGTVAGDETDEDVKALAERTLISQFRAGHREAVGELFEGHYFRVFQVAYQVLRNSESARDAAQEVFLRAYEELPNWRGEARFSTWLYRTALNVCFERMRQEDRHRRIREHLANDRWFPPPERDLLSSEAIRAVQHAVFRLPPRQRAIFHLKQFRDLPFREIAESLGISEGGAKASYHKALVSLRESLKPWSHSIA